MTIDCRESRSVLVTGGTRGLGKAIGLEFGRIGARVYLTHRWGSINEDELSAEFEAEGLAKPRIIESDASDGAASRELMTIIRDECGSLDVVVSNVAFAKIVRDLADLKRSTLELSLGYSAWPIVDLVQIAQEVLGAFPRYVIGVSSEGAEVCHDGYDLAGASKAVLETLCRFLALRLKPHGVRVNAIRPGYMDTASLRGTFGDDVVDTVIDQFPALFIDPRRVARVCIALCSGLMDAMTGQVLIIDEGWSLVAPFEFITGKGLTGAFPDVSGAKKWTGP